MKALGACVAMPSGGGQGRSSFCEQKEAKKLSVRFGDSAISRAPQLQGG
jgi:hypothetical protein